MRVLVTGAAGFIGRHVVPLLAAQGASVIAVSRQAGRAASRANVRWVEGDVLANGSLSEIIQRELPTHLLHLAWVTEPGVYWTSPDNSRWAEASAQLFTDFFGAGGGRAVGAGTCAEYDWSFGSVDDTTAIAPRTPYGAAKHHAHQALERAARRAESGFAWGRVHFLFGPGEPDSRFVPSLALALLRGERAICRKPALTRDWLHVSDVAAAFVALLGAPMSGAFNVVSGTSASNRDVAERIARAAGHADRLQIGDSPPSPGEPLAIRGTPGALANHWSPQLSLDAGIMSAVEALRNRPTE